MDVYYLHVSLTFTRNECYWGAVMNPGCSTVTFLLLHCVIISLHCSDDVCGLPLCSSTSWFICCYWGLSLFTVTMFLLPLSTDDFMIMSSLWVGSKFVLTSTLRCYFKSQHRTVYCRICCCRNSEEIYFFASSDVNSAVNCLREWFTQYSNRNE